MREKRDFQRVEPRGLSRAEAADYVGVSVGLFDAMVADGRMPQPRRVNARVIWDRFEIDRAFDNLAPNDGETNPWDSAA